MTDTMPETPPARSTGKWTCSVISTWIMRALSLVAIALTVALVWSQYSTDESTLDHRRHTLLPVMIGEHVVQVEVADETDLWNTGLSGHAPLAPDEGMLFVFQEKATYGFWMKEMLFPIDILWISDDQRVIGFTEQFEPSSYPEQRYPPESVRYVLEVSAGTVARLQIATGTQVQLPR
jgi:hypothetical protein